MLKRLVSISENLIKVSYYALFTITPLLVCPATHELFEFSKMLFVYAVTVVILAAFLVKIQNTKYSSAESRQLLTDSR